MHDTPAAKDTRSRALPPAQHTRFQEGEIEQSIPDRFAWVVTTHANRIAMLDDGRAYSYKELDQASSQVAHLILDALGRAQQPVALLLDQGATSVLAILGILKAGKVYIALDPGQSKTELNKVIADCSPGLIITDDRHRLLAREIVTAGVDCLDVQAIPAETRRDDPGIRPGPDSPATIFYTSGSTGRPKGVVDCHRNVLHNVMRYTNKLGIAADDRVSLVQSCGFSGTVSSLFSALLNGATICPFDLRNRGTAALANWINREHISIFHSVPSIFEQLLASGKRFDDLRLVRLEGDQVRRRHLRQLRQCLSDDCVLANGLGTTETGIVSQFLFGANSDLPPGVVPVGFANEDMEIEVLAEDGTPVANGEIGELCVRSRYLATGYWRRKQLTKAAFRRSSQDPDVRSYSTGDLGRITPDGCLTLLGRKDSRIKLRGQTIDMAQIEDALRDLPFVDRAVVVAKDGRHGGQQLLAYLVLTASNTPTTSEIRRQLGKTLPDLMLPARYVFLDKLPVSRHGKVLRRSLPAPDRMRPELGQEYVAPETPRQKIIADCFADVLQIDRVGMNDDFLDLGGDSMLATELLHRVQTNLEMPALTASIFLDRTVASLDRSFETGAHQGIVVPLKAGGNKAPLFCLHNHAGHVLEYRKLAELQDADRPVYGIQSRNGEQLVDFRLQDMAALYVSEILKIQARGPYYLCGNCFGGLVALEVAQQLQANGREVAVLALIDTAYPAGTFARLRRRLRPADNWRELSDLPLRQRLASLAGKVRRFLSWMMSKTARNVRFTRDRGSRTSKRPSLPESLRLEDFHRLLEERYRLKHYSGPLSLICLQLRENQLEWKKSGGKYMQIIRLEQHSSPDDNPHMVNEPYVQELADRLKNLLGDN
jgi:amino acid adenylation domain-containing protein